MGKKMSHKEFVDEVKKLKKQLDKPNKQCKFKKLFSDNDNYFMIIKEESSLHPGLVRSKRISINREVDDFTTRHELPKTGINGTLLNTVFMSILRDRYGYDALRNTNEYIKTQKDNDPEAEFHVLSNILSGLLEEFTRFYKSDEVATSVKRYINSYLFVDITFEYSVG